MPETEFSKPGVLFLPLPATYEAFLLQWNLNEVWFFLNSDL